MTHGGVFEGVGGFSLGARLARIQTKWVCEVDPFRKHILRKNFKGITVYGNIVNLENPPYVDIITGGFPCQNISVAGNFDGIIGSESRLWYEYLRIIHKGRPRYVVIENSVQLTNKGIEYILYDLAKAGYDAQWQNLSASQFGYPHKRERIFIVAYSTQDRRNEEWPVQMFQEVTSVLKRPYRQIILPVPVKRVKWNANHDDIRVNYGLPLKLDRERISAIGDAVVPEIVEYIMECIKIFDKKTYITPLE